MADYSKYVNLVAQALSDNTELNTAVNGQIVPGFNRTKADDYLKKSNHCCIGVRNLNINSTGLPGCDYHNVSDHDQLIEFHIIQKATDDAYIAGIADKIEQIMKKPITKTMNNIQYSVSTVGPIRFNPVDDDQFTDRVQITGTCRLKYLDE